MTPVSGWTGFSSCDVDGFSFFISSYFIFHLFHVGTVYHTRLGCTRPESFKPLLQPERLPGDEGAQSLATALAQLTQLKVLEVGLYNNHIGAGPRGAEGMAPGIGDLSAFQLEGKAFLGKGLS